MAEVSTSDANRWGVLLLAHGAPDSSEDVQKFLMHVRSGRKLPDHVIEEIARRYSLIGGSPLLCWTQRQAEALAAHLDRPVYVGMRNWRPFIAEAVAGIVQSNLRRLVVICLAPHNSRTSVGLYRRRLHEALEASHLDLSVHFVESWHSQPMLVRAFAEKLRTGLHRAEAAAAGTVPVIFTAHSVPEKTIAAGDPYDRQVKETAALVADAAGLKSWRFAYQSQGMTADPWLGPTVEEEIDILAEQGHRHVFIAPIGFVCDHVEILYDVDILFRKHAEKRQLTLCRSESLNDNPLLIDALASVALEQIRLRTPA